jgi:hypothetical protein
MRTKIFAYIITCILAALVPFLPVKSASREEIIKFPGWPEQFEGSTLKKLSLSEREERFAREFPGHIARFTDGNREIIVRWTTQASRKLHPASECFKGLGYTVGLGLMWIDQNGAYWRSFEAKKVKKFRVLERIYDQAGNSWAEVPAWYWATRLGKTNGPWWIVTIVENIKKEDLI